MKKKGKPPIKAKESSPDAPPANIEELRQLLIDITKGDANYRLGAKARDAFGKIF